MTTYYVASSGSDSNAGTSVSAPWASVAKVAASITSGTVVRGDTVRFRRGDTFYGRLNSIPNTANITGPMLTLAGYGPGARPVLSGYKLANTAASWIEHATGVWKLDITANSGAFSGDTANTNTNVGFLRVNNIIRPAKKSTLGALAQPWDFYSDAQYVYVAASANPTSLATDIRIATAGHMILATSCVQVTGLDLVGTGSHGVSIADNVGSQNVRVTGNRIHECGGSYLSGTTRYGNGAQVWVGSADILVSDNDFFDIYDVAYTMQGSADATNTGWFRCHARFNRIWNCEQSFEVWGDGTTGAGFVTCTFEYNVCINAGYSWSHAVRVDPRGVHVLVYQMTQPTDIAIRNNVFFDGRDAYLYSLGALPAGFVTNDNAIFQRPGTKIQTQTSQLIEQSAAWVTATGREVISEFYTAPNTAGSVDDALAFVASHAGAVAQHARVLHRAIEELRADLDTTRALTTGVPTRDIREYTATATAVPTPVGITGAYIDAIGAGGGGGAGRRGAAGSVRCGGGGGGSGGLLSSVWLPAAMFGATFTVTVGAGGSGGAAASTDSTDGGAGGTGGLSGIATGGAVVRATGGNPGGGGTATSGTAGSGGGGTPGGTAGGAAGSTGGVGAAGTTNFNGGTAAGGAGGGITTADAASAGAAGGTANAWGKSGGSAGVVNGAGPGTPSASTGTPNAGGGGGAASTTTAGQAGASGGDSGGGGGGGGAALNGNSSGAGGTGGPGYVRVTFVYPASGGPL